jgi:hypothetical protein
MDVDGRNPDDLEEGDVDRMLQSDDEGDTGNRSRRSAVGAGGDLPPPPPPPPPPQQMQMQPPSTAPSGSKGNANNKHRSFSLSDMRKSVNLIDTGSKSASDPPSTKVPDTPVTDTNLPIHYDRIRAARENWKRVTVMGGPPGMSRKWAPAYQGSPVGSFVVEGDLRHISVANTHNMIKKTNVATSFKPATLECLGCLSPHRVLTKSGDNRVCISVSDQCFPPLVQAEKNTKCVISIRVEDGSLDELVGALDLLTSSRGGGEARVYPYR